MIYILAILVVLLALGTTRLLSRFFAPPKAEGRFVSIDGLRGYLALFVFLHHSIIWYGYLHSGRWESPSSNLYNHFGQTSVALFFMITGFLFWTKLLESKNKSIDWLRLFVSRVLRLGPLYFVVLTLLFIIVAIKSDFQIKEPIDKLINGIISWLSFTMLGTPDLNLVPNTSIIVASVTWSLPYEWFFYLTLPVWALFYKIKTPWQYKVVGFLGLIGLILYNPAKIHLLTFLGGVIATYIVKQNKFSAFLNQRYINHIALFFILLTVGSFHSAYNPEALVLLSLFFIIISKGNTLFGLFAHPLSRLLGELTYGIYLLHGMLLYVVFNFIIGIEQAASFSLLEHSSIILLCTPVLISLSVLSFKFIESPMMLRVGKVTGWIRGVLK